MQELTGLLFMACLEYQGSEVCGVSLSNLQGSKVKLRDLDNTLPAYTVLGSW